MRCLPSLICTPAVNFHEGTALLQLTVVVAARRCFRISCLRPRLGRLVSFRLVKAIFFLSFEVRKVLANASCEKNANEKIARSGEGAS
jgi:hypothetical protein